MTAVRKSRCCLICGASGPGVLVRVDLCRDHQALLQGRSGLEEHHPEGRRNGLDTVPLPPSVHVFLTAEQARWDEALRYPSDDPVIRIARRIRIMQDYAEWYLRAAARDTGWLVALARSQQEKHGPDWWKRDQLAELDPKGADK